MQSISKQSTFSIKNIVMAGILSAVAILLGATRLGFIPVPNPSGNATIMHIPAIIGGILAGPVVGLIIGAFFGLYSFLQATTAFFRDPLVAILPRLFIGVTPFFAYIGLRRLPRSMGYIIAALIAILAVFLLSYSFTFTNPEATIDYAGIQLEGEAALSVLKALGIIFALLGLASAGAFTYFVYQNNMELLAIGVAAIVGTLTNTILVVGMLIIRGWFPAQVIIPAVMPQAIAEIVIAVVVTVAVVSAWKRLDNGRGGSSI